MWLWLTVCGCWELWCSFLWEDVKKETWCCNLCVTRSWHGCCIVGWWLLWVISVLSGQAEDWLAVHIWDYYWVVSVSECGAQQPAATSDQYQPDTRGCVTPPLIGPSVMSMRMWTNEKRVERMGCWCAREQWRLASADTVLSCQS